MTNSLLFLCPVCGYDRLAAPPYDEFNCATFEICPSCGTEFGYDDANVSVVKLRQNWIENGMPWFSRNLTKPLEWDPIAQLKNVNNQLFGLQQEVLSGKIDENPKDGITSYISHNGNGNTREHAGDGRFTRIRISETMTLDYHYDGQNRFIGIDDNGIAQSYIYAGAYLSMDETITGSYVFQLGATSATLYINHPNGPCGFCTAIISNMLPKGVELTIVRPGGSTTYIGNSR